MGGFAKRLLDSIVGAKDLNLTAKDQVNMEEFLNQPPDLSPGILDRLYQPAPGEPCLFCVNPAASEFAWIVWRYKMDSFGHCSPTSLNIIVSLPTNVVYKFGKIGNQVRERIRKEVEDYPDIPLSVEPPPMYVRGTTLLSMRWVMDVVRRDRISFEEAIQLSKALEKMT